MTSSVDGLVSGLSTSSMISSLMQVEAAPQTRLKSKVSAAQTIVSSYQSVNAKVGAMKTAADALSQLSTWRAVKPTVSSTSVTATSTGGTDTATGTVTFDVKQLAKAQSATMKVNTATVSDGGDPPKQVPVKILDDSVTELNVTIGTYGPMVDSNNDPVLDGDGNPVLGVTGKLVKVPITDRSAQGVAAALNELNIGVKASLVKIGETTSVLQINGTSSGADKAFSIAELTPGVSTDSKGLVTTTPASDAAINVGDPNNGGYTLTSRTNTFSGLMAGVSMTVSKLEDGITLTSSADSAGMAAKFQALVDAANATLTEIATQTAYDPETKQGSPLTGDFSVRQMSSAILGQISRGLTYRKADAPKAPGAGATDADIAADKLANEVNFGTLSKLGVELSSTGQLTFNAERFKTEYGKDPAAIQKAGIAFADQFEALAKTQTANVTSAITGRKTMIDSMNIQITDWDNRLVAKRESLQRQYSGLETALSKLKSQSTWLSGQIASLG